MSRGEGLTIAVEEAGVLVVVRNEKKLEGRRASYIREGWRRAGLTAMVSLSSQQHNNNN